MFFYLSIKQYAPVLTRFWFDFGASKKGGLCDEIWYGFPAPPFRDVWGCKILCAVDGGVIVVNTDRI